MNGEGAGVVSEECLAGPGWNAGSEIRGRKNVNVIGHTFRRLKTGLYVKAAIFITFDTIPVFIFAQIFGVKRVQESNPQKIREEERVTWF